MIENVPQKSLLTVKEFQDQSPINVRWAIQKHGCRLEETGAVIPVSYTHLTLPTILLV